MSYKHSEESKKKISEAMKKRYANPKNLVKTSGLALPPAPARDNVLIDDRELRVLRIKADAFDLLVKVHLNGGM